MATYPKITDNEMNYFQYKAQQMVLLKKEDREWQDFCKQVAPECAACLADEAKLKVSKDIGIQAAPGKIQSAPGKIQTAPGKPVDRIGRRMPDSRHQNEKIPEALENIKTRLEKIDFAISRMYDVSYESETADKKPAITSISHDEKALRSFEEHRRILIQNRLRDTLKKLYDSPQKMQKKSAPAIKQKNSGYFIPHDLQVKRAAARRAYLKSLQTKPKVSFRNVSLNNKKDVQTSENTKHIPKHSSISKPKKKGTIRKMTKELNIDKEETLVGNTKDDETKDENIEFVVDGILDDLLGDTALDLNKIRQRKVEKELISLNSGGDVKIKERIAVQDSLPSSSRNTKLGILGTDDDDYDNNSLLKLKLFLGLPKRTEQNSEILRKNLEDKSTSNTSDQKNTVNETIAPKTKGSTLHKKLFEIKNPPKFICSVSSLITVDPEEATNISRNKERFWEYLKRISRRVKGNFNPWILNEMLAESILDECISDIAEELNAIPSNVVKDLYDEEFVRQIED